MDNIKILVIDDEEMIRRNLSIYLEDEGYDIYQTDNAESALEMIRENDYDLAIVDVRLPGMSGDELIKKAEAIKPDLKYIIHTGSSDFTMSIDLKNLGLDERHVYTKPIIDMTKLSNGIKQILGID